MHDEVTCTLCHKNGPICSRTCFPIRISTILMGFYHSVIPECVVYASTHHKTPFQCGFTKLTRNSRPCVTRLREHCTIRTDPYALAHVSQSLLGSYQWIRTGPRFLGAGGLSSVSTLLRSQPQSGCPGPGAPDLWPMPWYHMRCAVTYGQTHNILSHMFPHPYWDNTNG